ncbi:ATP-dependent RecD-like DNA helicase, partial [Butyricicoccus sp. 1XD8-22]
EQKLAQKLSILRGSWGGEAMPSLDKHIKRYQAKNKIILAEKQREAVRRLMEEQILILTGGPGTGKTTVVKAMIDIYKELNPKGIIRLAAPTGRASRKLEESTGYEAMTIHRMIGFRHGELPEYHSDNRLAGDLIVIDEFSMVDLQIAFWLVNALERDAKILFIGDTDQLPSVGSGNVLSDLIESGLPTVQLTEIFRQAEESQIITNAHRINNGKSLLIDKEKKDFYFIRQNTPANISDFIIKSAVRFIELGYSLEDILILSPMRKGDAGID